jgi:hypothetical protein
VPLGRPNVVVLRAQLPKHNPFYAPPEEDEDDEEEEDEGKADDAAADAADADGVIDLDASARTLYDPDIKMVPVGACALCGMPAALRCGRCQGPRYCSKAHQTAHWRAPKALGGHRHFCATPTGKARGPAEFVAASALSACYTLPEWSLVVDPEPSAAERASKSSEGLSEGAAAALQEATARMSLGQAAGAAASLATGQAAGAAAGAGAGAEGSSEKAGKAPRPEQKASEEEGLSLQGLTQKKLSEITGRQLFADRYMNAFVQRVACEPSQVLRYCRWPGEAFEDPPPPPAATEEAAKPPQSSPEKAEGEDDGDDEKEEEDDEENEPFGAPLWLSAKHQPPKEKVEVLAEEGDAEKGDEEGWEPLYRTVVPPCARCGCARRFEFQLLPQSISKLQAPTEAAKVCSQALREALAEESDDGATAGGPDDPRPLLQRGIDLDFGTLAVYTCTGSCNPPSKRESMLAIGGPALAPSAEASPYSLEYCWVQPSEDEATSASVAAQAAREADKEAAALGAIAEEKEEGDAE